MTPRRRLTAVALIVVVSAGLLSACGGSKEKASEPASTEPSASPTVATPVYAPLTGVEVTAERKHPVIVVKMDNTPASRPQVGVDKADVVVEELVEGGLTRLALFFDSSMPAEVGPVRSLRATDIGVVKPIKATVVASGAAWVTLRRLQAAKVDLWLDPGAGTAGAKHFYRVTTRSSPYNLMFALAKFAKETKPHTAHPRPLFTFDHDQEWAGTKLASKIDVGFSYGRHTLWAFRGGAYVNTNPNSVTPYRADTVIVVRVREGDAGYTDPAGNPVPETVLTGSGPMVMFHNGTMVKGQWFKDGRDNPLQFKANGVDLKVPVGRTWVELAPMKNFGGSLRVTG